MVVTMICVRVVQVTVDEIVDVITVGDWLVTAAGSVHMVGIVCTTSVIGGALRGVGPTFFERVLVDVVPMNMMEMAVMQVVDMSIVRDGRVSTVLPMLVRMTLMLFATHGFIGAYESVGASTPMSRRQAVELY